MEPPTVSVISGRDIPKETLRKLQRMWLTVFDVHNPLWKRDEELLPNDVFFIVYSGKRIMSAGRLRSISLTFRGKRYGIQGIADIASVVKNRGFGTLVMKSMHDYLMKGEETGIGFADKENASFYRKCSFKVNPDIRARFYYRDKEGRLRTVEDEVVIYLERDELIKEILKHPESKVLSPIYFW